MGSLASPSEIVARFEYDKSIQISVLWWRGDRYIVRCMRGVIVPDGLYHHPHALLRDGHRLPLISENDSWMRGWGRVRSAALIAAHVLR